METNRRGFFGAMAALMGSSIFTLNVLAEDKPKGIDQSKIRIDISNENGFNIHRITLKKDTYPIFKRNFDKVGFVRNSGLNRLKEKSDESYFEGDPIFFLKPSMFLENINYKKVLREFAIVKPNMMKANLFLGIISYENTPHKQAFIVTDKPLEHVSSFVN